MYELVPSPLSTAYLCATAKIYALAFAGGDYAQWLANTPDDARLHSADDIPPARLARTTLEHKHRELNPRVVFVCAVSKGEVIGYSSWLLPSSLSRSESFTAMTYRKAVEYINLFNNWVSPPKWLNQRRFNKYWKAQREFADRYLGKGKIDHTWYLRTLCVYPEHQRKGVGGELLDWGLKQAGERGEKVYLEATEAGKGLYLQKSFKELGMMVVEDGGEEVVDTCMLWTPSKPKQI
jgi:GNAT superfamily N-acetyltransferase